MASRVGAPGINMQIFCQVLKTDDFTMPHRQQQEKFAFFFTVIG
jgi:hypothetical protein